MTTVVYSDAFVPAELIAAAGFRPCRVPPDRSAGAGRFALTEGLCPLARAMAACVADSSARAVVLTTACDQMRRAGEMPAGREGRPCFLLNLPHTCGANAFSLYLSELERLAGFLCEVGGRPVAAEELEPAMARYEAGRRALRAGRDRLTGRQLHQAILDHAGCGEFVWPPAAAWPARADGAEGGAVAVAVVGSPLMAGDAELFDVIERLGGRIALDATDSGELALPPPAAGADGPALERLARSYWAMPGAFRRPNDALYACLDRELSARAVGGIVLRRYAWCDTWHAELGRLRSRYSQPVLDLDCTEPLSPYTLTRVEAFLEVLRAR